jgi:large subunit ribosomal protein L29
VTKAKEGRNRLRDLPDEELEQALERAREELFRLRLGNYTNQVENTISLRFKRRELARILTLQRARQLALEAQASVISRAVAEAAGEQPTAAPFARPARPKHVGKPKKAAAPASGEAGSKAAKKATRTAAKAAKASGAASKKKSGKE